ncbi:Arginase [Sulfitobacter noctilucae]|uniref:arginase n=1 Tax=Sulfitobacter noctilucae TaxID=1342302 RepID=UPI000468F6EA|nr:arginase [Sulfitobacter noctilucae]KIN60881.1 Arginase [Sulfitobacter noctilucae]
MSSSLSDKPKCILVGVPLDCGKTRKGCLMGPDAYRTAGLANALGSLGHSVEDRGNVAPAPFTPRDHPKLVALEENIAWTESLADASQAALNDGLPIFMGGDHALSLGTVLGAMRHAETQNRPLFVLWLDAHTDFHTPHTTDSGNLHGTPLGYVTGRDGFDGFPAIADPLPHAQVAIIGLRSVDAAERDALQQSDVTYVDMREIDETGIARPLTAFLDRVAAANGLLHVSLDVDFLDPSVAPAVGTTVPGGATVREGHLVMEMLHDSGLMTSLDLVELNPFLDERGRTASLMVDLTASAFGRRVFDRPTRAY